VLIPAAAVLVIVALWSVWLPRTTSGGTVARTTTTIDSNPGLHPTHRVTTIARAVPGRTPSRRSETLTIVLLFLGVGLSLVGVFHRRIGTIDLGRNGIRIELTRAQQAGAARLASRLAATGAPRGTYAVAFERYLSALSRRDSHGEQPVRSATSAIDEERATGLADAIADAL